MSDSLKRFICGIVGAMPCARPASGADSAFSYCQSLRLGGFASAVFVLLAELHGRIGHFPTLIHLRPLAGSTPTIYEVAELINLQAIREEARRRRY